MPTRSSVPRYCNSEHVPRLHAIHAVVHVVQGREGTLSYVSDLKYVDQLFLFVAVMK